MTHTESNVVIAGAGAAGHAAATTLRREGYTGRITLVHGEQVAPYNRTLVNKAVLQGLLTPEQIALPALDELELETVRARVQALDERNAVLTLSDGRRLGYSALIAATGSAPRRGDDLGADLDGRVFHIHSVDDATRVREKLGDSPADVTVAVLGAGFIGAETASFLAEVGAAVHLVSRPSVPLARVLGSRIADRVKDLHNAHVITHFGRQVDHIESGPDGVTVKLDDGQRLDADLAVIAHGTAPASSWATGSSGGVDVDARLRAVAMPGVYAAGSVAVHATTRGGRYRTDHWDAATAQGAHAARTVLHDLTGAADPGPYVPDTGFTLNLYRTPITAYGPVLPDATEREQEVDGGIVTTFHTPDDTLVAAVGLSAAMPLFALRSALGRP